MIDTDALTSHPRVIAKALELAADYIDRYGWHRSYFSGIPQDGKRLPPCCAAGALNSMTCGAPELDDDALFYRGRPWRSVLSAEAKIALLDNLGLGWEPCEHRADHELDCCTCDSYLDWVEHLDVNVGDWNDAPGRTQLEVTAALRGTAIDLRQDVAR